MTATIKTVTSRSSAALVANPGPENNIDEKGQCNFGLVCHSACRVLRVSCLVFSNSLPLPHTPYPNFTNSRAIFSAASGLAKLIEYPLHLLTLVRALEQIDQRWF